MVTPFTQKNDLRTLKTTIDDLARRKSILSVPFAHIYTNIWDGKGFTAKKKGDKPIKAIHIEVAENNVDVAKNLFSHIYGSKVTSFPLQIRMRYVLSVKNTTDSKTKKQILTLWNKQDWFLGSITHA